MAMSDTPGRTIKRARTERQLSYRQLSNLTGLGVNTIRRIEDDDEASLFPKFAALCRALDIDPRSLDSRIKA